MTLLIVGMPAFGTLFAPSMALLSSGAQRLELNQGLAFGLGNLSWATGQAVAAASGRRHRPGDLGHRPVRPCSPAPAWPR